MRKAKRDNKVTIENCEVTAKDIEAVLKSEGFVNLDDKEVIVKGVRGYTITEKEDYFDISIKEPFYAGVAAQALSNLKYIVVVTDYLHLYVNKAKEKQAAPKQEFEALKNSEVNENELIGATVVQTDTQRAGYQPQIILQKDKQYFSVCITEHGKVQITQLYKTDFKKVRVLIRGLGSEKEEIDSSFLLSPKQWKEFGEKYCDFVKSNLIGGRDGVGYFGLWIADYETNKPESFGQTAEERKEMVEKFEWLWPQCGEYAYTIKSIEVLSLRQISEPTRPY